MLSGEALPYATANRDNLARLDVAASGFWGCHTERAFFDVRVFNPFASSNATTSLSAFYCMHERCKSRAYERRCINVERASFTPLVFSATGGMAPRARQFFQRLCNRLSAKRDDSYSKTMGLVQAMISFLLKDTIACLRGARSVRGRFDHISSLSVDVAAVESRIVV